MAGGWYDRRPQWRREVLRTARLTHSTKLVLLVLHEHMRPDGKVSVSRRTVADALGWRHIRRVSEHLTSARDAGFLVTVIEGSYGRTAVWQGVFPGDVRVRETSTLTDVANPHPYDPSKGADCPHPITKADPGPQPQADMALMSKPSPAAASRLSNHSADGYDDEAWPRPRLVRVDSESIPDRRDSHDRLPKREARRLVIRHRLHSPLCPVEAVCRERHDHARVA
jgi:hypothetical protein